MGTVTATSNHYATKGMLKVEWPAMAGGDDGAWVKLDGWQLASVAVELEGAGDFGTSSVEVQGRVLGSSGKSHVLNDPQGNALTGIAAEKIEAIQEPVEEVRPVVAAGTGTGILVTVWAKRTT